MTQTGDKERVARLLEGWLERAGIGKGQGARRVGLTYHEFHRAYFDLARPLNADADLALEVVRAFAEGRRASERPTAAEALAFLSHARFPLHRFQELENIQAFSPHELRAALAAYLPQQAHMGVAEAQQPSPPEPPANNQAVAQPPLALLPLDAAPPVAPLPLPHRMPRPRNPLFQGRAGELRAIAAALNDALASQGMAVAIAGIAGIGKTSLAGEFVHRYGQFFAGGVFWLSCTDPAAIPAEALACADAGLLPANAASPLPRLLVLDGCEDDALLARWRPASGGCRVLLTSRRASWGRAQGVVVIGLRELPRAASVALLAAHRPVPPGGEAPLDQIAAALGDLPLALRLAGSYLETQQGAPAQAAAAQLAAELSAADPLAHPAFANAGEQSIARPYGLSIARLDPTSPADATARALLAHLAYGAPGVPLPTAALAALVGPAPAATALRRLADLGLLGEVADGVALHPLVAAATRAALGTPHALAETGRSLASLALRLHAADDAAALRALAPHLAARAEAASGRSDEGATRLHHALALALDALGDFDGSLRALQHAYTALERSGALETQLAADVLHALGALRRDAGELVGGRAALEAALALRTRLLEPGDLAIAESCHALAELLCAQGESESALGLFEWAATLRAGALGPLHSRTQDSQHGGARVLLRAGRNAEAAARFTALLATAEEQSERAGRAHHDLGVALLRQRDAARARTHFEQAQAILGARLGLRHPDAQRARHYLALLDSSIYD